MTAWLIAPLVILIALGLGVMVWCWRRQRQRTREAQPLTMKWRDEHAYDKRGDRGK